MDAILSDTSKFQLLNEDPVKVTLQRENQVKSLMKKLKAANSLNEKTYNELYPSGSRIGKTKGDFCLIGQVFLRLSPKSRNYKERNVQSKKRKAIRR